MHRARSILGNQLAKTTQNHGKSGQATTRITNAIAITLGLVVLVLCLAALGQVATLAAMSLPGMEYSRAQFVAVIGSIVGPLLALPLMLFAINVARASEVPAERHPRIAWRGVVLQVRRTVKLLGFRNYTLRQWREMLLLGTLVAIFFSGLNYLILTQIELPQDWFPAVDLRMTPKENATPVMTFVHGLLYAPLSEELLYRGPLVIGMWVLHVAAARQKITSRTNGVFVVALAAVTTVWFASAHSPSGVYNVISAGAFGIAAALMTVRCKGLIPGIIAHALYNALVTLY